MKTCSRCGKRRRKDKFRKKSRSPDGLGSWCKDCHRERHKEYYHEKKEKWQNEKKRRRKETKEAVDKIKDKPCADCGRKFPPYVMDFDHRDPSKKKFNIGYAVSVAKSMSSILKEIAKCDLVCSNCHRIRTHGGDDV